MFDAIKAKSTTDGHRARTILNGSELYGNNDFQKCLPCNSHNFFKCSRSRNKLLLPNRYHILLRLCLLYSDDDVWGSCSYCCCMCLGRSLLLRSFFIHSIILCLFIARGRTSTMRDSAAIIFDASKTIDSSGQCILNVNRTRTFDVLISTVVQLYNVSIMLLQVESIQ